MNSFLTSTDLASLLQEGDYKDISGSCKKKFGTTLEKWIFPNDTRLGDHHCRICNNGKTEDILYVMYIICTVYTVQYKIQQEWLSYEESGCEVNSCICNIDFRNGVKRPITVKATHERSYIEISNCWCFNIQSIAQIFWKWQKEWEELLSKVLFHNVYTYVLIVIYLLLCFVYLYCDVISVQITFQSL